MLKLPRALTVVVFLVAMLGPTPTHAAMDENQASSNKEFSMEDARWEFGAQTGVSFPVGARDLSITGNHSAFLVSDPASLGEDEFAENNLPSPDFTGHTEIKARLRPSFVIGGHFFYHLTDWVSPGIEGFYAAQYSPEIIVGGPFKSSIYRTVYHAHSGQITPVVRLGGWMGPIRPYGIVGAGPFYFVEEVTSELADPDDPQHPPVVGASRDHAYLCTIVGGGIDFNWFNRGSVGFAIRYEHVYNPGTDMQFFVPAVHFNTFF